MTRVLVIQSKHLLAAGILNLLLRETDLAVFNAAFQDDITLLKEIHKIQPAVLILDESSPLANQLSFFSFLDACPHLRVILVEERKNRMQIYEKKEVEVGRAADLVTAIRRGE